MHRKYDAKPSVFVESTLGLNVSELVKNVVSWTDCHIANSSLSTEYSAKFILNIEIN